MSHQFRPFGTEFTQKTLWDTQMSQSSLGHFEAPNVPKINEIPYDCPEESGRRTHIETYLVPG